MAVPASADVSRWLATLPVDDMGGVADQITLTAAMVNPSSLTWRAVVSGKGGTRTVFLKHHASPVMFKRERRALELLRPYSAAGEPYRVPRLIGVDPALRLIALDWLHGESVGHALRQAVDLRSDSACLERGVALAREVGGWLCRFEQRTASGRTRAFPAAGALSRIKMLNDFMRSGRLRGYDHALARAVESNALENISQLRHRYPQSAVHRDFWFQHIWSTDTGITVIDFGRCIPGPPGRDAAQFYARLDDLTVLNPLVSARKVRMLQTAFLAGYRNPNLHEPHFRLYTLLTRLEQLAGMVEAPPSGLLDRSVYTVRVRALLRSLKKGL